MVKMESQGNRRGTMMRSVICLGVLGSTMWKWMGVDQGKIGKGKLGRELGGYGMKIGVFG
jgi:hypothetical protein